MAAIRAGVSPAESAATLTWVLRALRQRGAFGTSLDPALEQLAQGLLTALPSNLLPDVYLVQPLMGDATPQVGFALDMRERNYLNYHTDGAYFEHLGMEAATANPEVVCGLVATERGTRPFRISCATMETSELADSSRWDSLCAELGLHGDDGPVVSLLRSVQALPLRTLVRTVGPRRELVIALPRAPRQRFWDAPYRDTLLQALAAAGANPARLASLASIALRCGVPCHSALHGFLRWEACVDVSHVALTLLDGQVVGGAVGVRITERTKPLVRSAFRPSRIYQWHITDECDQRCKHCYLFAEDAQRPCTTMPFDELMRVLDEVEGCCARRHMLPSFVVTGGDPILHPRFWDLAEELHRRGFLWAIMGNPFHLDDAVCRRLHELGCVRYQLSLDGLRPFHDSLRKPGSFDATMAAIRPLKDNGILVQMMATASRQNLSDILACMDLVVERGVDYFAFARYCATSPDKAAALYPTPEEYRAFLLAYYEKRRRLMQAGARCEFRLKEHLFRLLRYELGEFEVPAFSRERPDVICDGCHLGSRATIASNGDLLACRRMTSVVGNIATSHLSDVEDGAAMRAYRRVDAIRGCADCKLLMWCRGCRAVGFNVTGDLQAADPMCWHCVRE